MRTRSITRFPTSSVRWAYGIPELFADAIAGVNRVAAPGCYPTSAVLGLAPLVAANLIEPGGLIVDSMSGVSGAGRGVSEGLMFGSIDESVKAYKVLQHRHQPEMERALDLVADHASISAVHPAPRADAARHPFHDVRDDAARYDTSRPGECARRGVRNLALCSSDRITARDPVGCWLEQRTPVGPSRRAHRYGCGPQRDRQSRQGGCRPGCAVRKPDVRSSPKAMASPRKDGCHERCRIARLPCGRCRIRASSRTAAIWPSLLPDRPAAPPVSSQQNQAAAAPVQVSRSHLLIDGTASAVVINSGCANAGTGTAGHADAQAMTAAVAESIGVSSDGVLVCSTGTIGPRLPMDHVLGGIAQALAGVSNDESAGTAAADAIRTTDSVTKEATFTGDGWTVGGMAKGSGMVRRTWPRCSPASRPTLPLKARRSAKHSSKLSIVHSTLSISTVASRPTTR